MINDNTLSPGGVTMKASKNFTKKELACPCCNVNGMQQAFIEILQRIRDKVGEPMPISSGYRCAKHNTDVGGEKNSAHLRGWAVDIAISKKASGLRHKIVYYAMQEGIRRIGIGRNLVHLDMDVTLPSGQMWVY